MSDIEEVRMFRKFKKEDEQKHKDNNSNEKLDAAIIQEIMKKIEGRQVISREEFKIYEKYEKYQTYTKDWYPFQCPKCSDSYDVIIRGNTADEKIIQILYVEDEKAEK